MYGLPFVFVFFVINFPVGSDRLLDHDEPLDGDSGLCAAQADGPDLGAQSRRRKVRREGDTEDGADTIGSRFMARLAAVTGAGASTAEEEPEAKPARGGSSKPAVGCREGQRQGQGPIDCVEAATAAEAGRTRARARSPPRRAEPRCEAVAQRPAAASATQEEEAFGQATLMSAADDEELGPAEAVEDLLEEVVRALGLDATVEVTEDDETVTGTVHGDDLGLFIGRHGQTIDAVQHLAQRMAGARAAAAAGGSSSTPRATASAARRCCSARPTTRQTMRCATAARSRWTR